MFYDVPPSPAVRMRLAEYRLAERFVVIPIPLAAVTQTSGDRQKATSLVEEYARRYLPGADLFDDRNAVSDTFLYFGRSSLLQRLEDELTHNQAMVLFGLRKSGKTSVLLQLPVRMKDFPVIHVDLQRYGGSQYFGAEIFQEMLNTLTAFITARNATLIGNAPDLDLSAPAVKCGGAVPEAVRRTLRGAPRGWVSNACYLSAR